MLTGNATSPVSAVAVIVPAAPTLIVATANAPAPATLTTPSFAIVAASATMSGTGVGDAENNSVFSPVVIGAWVPPHAKLNCTSVGGIAWPGLTASTNVCGPPAGRLTGLFLVPATC